MCFMSLLLNSAREHHHMWTQFKQAKLSATEPTLPDFSYAGYNYSETPIPDTSSWPIFDVTNYGAVVNDGNYDDAAIQATINAAQEDARTIARAEVLDQRGNLGPMQ